MAISDPEIIDLYWQRNEKAISETDLKYRSYLMKISKNVLSCQEDCEENLNDTYLKTWNALPPERPGVLSMFLAKITRRGAIDLWRMGQAKKRGSGTYDECLEELEDLVSGQESVEDHILSEELAGTINRWLGSLPKEKRVIFLGRYFYADSVKEIAAYTGQSEAKVKVTLYRCRQDLKERLEKEGYQV